jgi:hypothetical protein
VTTTDDPNLFDPPPKYTLPLVKGQDLVVDFKNKVPGSNPAEYEDYADGTAVSLVIETDPVTTVVAAMDGFHAVARVESTASDGIAAGKLWRCVVSLPGTPTTERVGANGKTKRFDGK